MSCKDIEWMKVVGQNVWTMRDGTKVKFCEMDTGHLRNVARMMMRHKERCEDTAMAAACYSGSGDMAGYYADIDHSRASDEAMKAEADALLTMEYAKAREARFFLSEGPR